MESGLPKLEEDIVDYITAHKQEDFLLQVCDRASELLAGSSVPQREELLARLASLRTEMETGGGSEECSGKRRVLVTRCRASIAGGSNVSRLPEGSGSGAKVDSRNGRPAGGAGERKQKCGSTLLLDPPGRDAAHSTRHVGGEAVTREGKRDASTDR
ncbi:MAG: hypothetical protein WBR26_04280 [Candidatus Acidiferrum sp.]